LHIPQNQVKNGAQSVGICTALQICNEFYCILFPEMNSEFVSAMKHVFLKLGEEETLDDSTVDFVPSLTPQKTNLETIFASQPSAFQSSATGIPSSADILKQDFTSTTLQHLIKPEL
jgi:hypothetical protein